MKIQSFLLVLLLALPLSACDKPEDEDWWCTYTDSCKKDKSDQCSVWGNCKKEDTSAGCSVWGNCKKTSTPECAMWGNCN